MKIKTKKYYVDNENINIVHISDIHFYNKYKMKRLNMIKEHILECNPKYICITGDLIDSADVTNDNIDVFVDWLQDLSNVSKIMIVLGNHDVEHKNGKKSQYYINKYYINQLSNKENIFLLRNTNYETKDINFIGYEVNYKYYEEDNYDGVTKDINNVVKHVKDKYNVLLVHTPSVILDNEMDKLNLKKIDLILCGHTHGGLMPDIIPGHRGIISPKKGILKNNMRGCYKINRSTLIISNGIMKLSYKSHLTYFNDLYNMDIVNILGKK